jgi:hypothetical protein
MSNETNFVMPLESSLYLEGMRVLYLILAWGSRCTKCKATRDHVDDGPCGFGHFWTCVCSGMASPDVNSTHYESTQIMLAAQLKAVSSVMYSMSTAPPPEAQLTVILIETNIATRICSPALRTRLDGAQAGQ